MVAEKIIPVSETLTDLSAQMGRIEASIATKIASNMTTLVNENIDKKLKIDLALLKHLLSSFESRLRECEMIYFSYLRDADHDVLSGSSKGLPLAISIRLSYASSILEKDLLVNDKTFYKELIDAQFRHFILAMASQYEVIVKLAEILVKKVIIHYPNKPPLSAPLDHYIAYLKGLVNLEYRTQDDIFQCTITHEPFLSKYLLIINRLRNSFMHGFSSNLQSDGASYRVIKADNENQFSDSSPELELDVFSKTIMESSRNFFTDMLDAIDNAIKDHAVYIPA